MNGCSTLLTAACLSAAILLASAAQARAFQQARKAEPPAVTLRAFENARHDPSAQSQLLKTAYHNAVARTLVSLRDTHFKDGKEKTPQRMERDMAQARRLEAMVGHLTDQQSAKLVNMIAEYADAQPNTELEDVVVSFLLTEANKPAAPATAR